jgi:hypothetical protein
MKIPYSKDVVNDEPPSFEKGDLPWANPGIEPHESAIPEDPGMKASNPTTPEEYNKATPYKPKQGSGYTS